MRDIHVYLIHKIDTQNNCFISFRYKMDTLIRLVDKRSEESEISREKRARRIIRAIIGENGFYPLKNVVVRNGLPYYFSTDDHIAMLQVYAPILTRRQISTLSSETIAAMSEGAIVDSLSTTINTEILSPETLAIMSEEDILKYLLTLTDWEAMAGYQGRVVDSRVDDPTETREKWLTTFAKTFRDIGFMMFSYANQNRTRAVNLSVTNGNLLSGTQTSFYVYQSSDVILNTITEDLKISRDSADPHRATHGDFFSSEEIMTLQPICHNPNHTYDAFFAHHKRIVTLNKVRATHITLRHAGLLAGGYEEELYWRNIR